METKMGNRPRHATIKLGRMESHEEDAFESNSGGKLCHLQRQGNKIDDSQMEDVITS
jgi:hypothetical protein